MLNRLIFLCSVITLILSNKINAQIFFDRIYDSNARQYGISVKQTSDSSIFLYGYETEDAVLRTDLTLRKINAEGNLIWKKSYSPGGDDLGLFLLNYRNQHLLLTGTIYETTGFSHAFMLAVDMNGDTLWQKKYYFSVPVLIKHADTTLDGGVLLTGHILDEFGNNDFLVFKTDALGNQLWQKSMGNQYNQYFKQVKQLRNGGLIGIGDVQTPQADYDVAVIRMDDMGNEIWYKQYGDEFENGSQGIIETQDGNFLMYGENQVEFAGAFDFLLVKITQNGDTIWAKNIGTKRPDAAFSVIENDDHSFTLTGYSVIANGFPIALTVAKIDENGLLLWQKWYNETTLAIGTEIIPALSGGYLVAATQYTTPLEKAELLHINEDGVLNIRNNISGNASNVIIYPNPANEILNLEFADPGPNERLINIYSSDGKKCQQQKTMGSKFQLNISSLVPGIYIIEYITNDVAEFIRFSKF
jgi:hypothetical protein